MAPLAIIMLAVFAALPIAASIVGRARGFAFSRVALAAAGALSAIMLVIAFAIKADEAIASLFVVGAALAFMATSGFVGAALFRSVAAIGFTTLVFGALSFCACLYALLWTGCYWFGDCL